jgi:hypothetical protein
MADDMGALRSEIMESEKIRYDLLKWKLALVAALGAAGLGIGAAGKADGVESLNYVLCLIPLVCLYTDVLCAHMNLRIMVIGRYLRTVPARNRSWEGYENFVQAARSMKRRPPVPSDGLSAFVLEDWALRWSTTGLSVLLIVYASLLYGCGEQRPWIASLTLICGLAANLVPPLLSSRVHAYGLIAPMVAMALVPYVTLTGVHPVLAVSADNVLPWTVFLTSGMLGMLFPAFIDVIYRARCGAIEGLPPVRSTKADRQ